MVKTGGDEGRFVAMCVICNMLEENTSGKDRVRRTMCIATVIGCVREKDESSVKKG